MIYMRNITITTAKSATYLENVGLNRSLPAPLFQVMTAEQVRKLPHVGSAYLIASADPESVEDTRDYLKAGAAELKQHIEQKNTGDPIRTGGADVMHTTYPAGKTQAKKPNNSAKL